MSLWGGSVTARSGARLESGQVHELMGSDLMQPQNLSFGGLFNDLR